MGMEGVDRPPDDGAGGLLLEPGVQLRQLAIGELWSVHKAHVAHSLSPVSAT